MSEINKDSLETPLFPLSINVLPGAYLPLQIFEPRYLDMVKDRLSKQEGFCIVLSQPEDGSLDSEGLPQHSATGTYVEVVDFNQLENGLLGLTVQGKYRAQVLDRKEQDDGLLLGTIIQLKEPEDDSLQHEYENIWRVLEEISEHPEIKKLRLLFQKTKERKKQSLFPIIPSDKQSVLESNSNNSRFKILEDLLKKLGG